MRSTLALAAVLGLAGCHDFAALSKQYGAAVPGDLGADLAVVHDLASSQGDLPFPTAPDLANADLSGPPVDLSTPPIVGHLSGSGAASASVTDLTATGTLDWAHWGYPSAAMDHKASSTSQISNYTPLGGAAAAYSNNPVGYSWSDGTATPSVTSTTTGVFVAGMGAGFQITVPASTVSRTLLVYVGGYRSKGQLTATLSDLSAPAYSDASFADLVDNIYDATYTITYNAAKPGQTLTITWTALTVVMDGNVSLQSVALK